MTTPLEPPKATPPWVRTLRVLLVGAVLGGLAVVLWGSPQADPTHPHAEAPSAGAEVWTCSMHPQIRQPEPGPCPICGMDLIPVGDAGGALPPNRVSLSDRARALAKLRTTTVRRQPGVAADLKLLGRLEANEATLKTVTSWIDGRIDTLHVKETGKRVRSGQSIATLYSPEVYAAHQDLLVSKRQLARMASSSPLSRVSAEAAYDAARERLTLLGLPQREIDRLEKAKSPTRAVTIRSPFSGTVIERLATEGSYVDTGTALYRIANLRTLWVQLDAYESDLSRIAIGQDVQVEVEAVPDALFEGTVTFIDPVLDRTRRTARVRVQLDNDEGLLRPGMFAEATVATKQPEGTPQPLVVPSTAPLFTGRRAVVYVESDDGDRPVYEARTVRLGPRLGSVYPVVAGLAQGERVVTAGAFALDADLQIRGGRSMMTSTDDLDAGAGEQRIALTPEQRAPLAPVLRAYLRAQVALAADELEAAQEAAETFSDLAAGVSWNATADAAAAWAPLGSRLREHAQRVGAAETLEQARAGFEPLSNAMIGLLGRFGNPLDTDVHLAHCPMAARNEGALWLQATDEVDNPYFGASMPGCGDIRKRVAPGAYLRPPTRSGPAAGGHRH
ncbi:MAG: efflux RND transporter periplasmic adaptor subunit [Nannocystaceae bacterium]|nr:efflux RND transporter periplasmic adaptor subunit [bacterium]